MKNEIQLILEEIKNIEESKNAEVVMQDEIAKICEKHGTTFEEFRNSVLKILADEIGISIDELESLSFKEIKEEDLMNVSGGASKMQRITAASLAALLGYNTFVSPRAEGADISNEHLANVKRHDQGELAEQYDDDDEFDEQDDNFDEESVGDKQKFKRLAGLGSLTLATMATIFGMPALIKFLASPDQNNYKEKSNTPEFRFVDEKQAKETFEKLKRSDCEFWMAPDCFSKFSNEREADVHIIAVASSNGNLTDVLLDIKPSSSYKEQDINKLIKHRISLSTHPFKGTGVKDNFTKWIEKNLGQKYGNQTVQNNRTGEYPYGSSNSQPSVPIIGASAYNETPVSSSSSESSNESSDESFSAQGSQISIEVDQISKRLEDETPVSSSSSGSSDESSDESFSAQGSQISIEVDQSTARPITELDEMPVPLPSGENQEPQSSSTSTSPLPPPPQFSSSSSSSSSSSPSPQLPSSSPPPLPSQFQLTSPPMPAAMQQPPAQLQVPAPLTVPPPAQHIGLVPPPLASPNIQHTQDINRPGTPPDFQPIDPITLTKLKSSNTYNVWLTSNAMMTLQQKTTKNICIIAAATSNDENLTDVLLSDTEKDGVCKTKDNISRLPKMECLRLKDFIQQKLNDICKNTETQISAHSLGVGALNNSFVPPPPPPSMPAAVPGQPDPTKTVRSNTDAYATEPEDLTAAKQSTQAIIRHIGQNNRNGFNPNSEVFAEILEPNAIAKAYCKINESDKVLRYQNQVSCFQIQVDNELKNIPGIVESDPVNDENMVIDEKDLFNEESYAKIENKEEKEEKKRKVQSYQKYKKNPNDKYIDGQCLLKIFNKKQGERDDKGREYFRILGSASQCDHLESTSAKSVALLSYYHRDKTAGPTLAAQSISAGYKREKQMIFSKPAKISNMYDEIKQYLSDKIELPKPVNGVNLFNNGYINFELAGGKENNAFKQKFAEAIVKCPPKHYSQVALSNDGNTTFGYAFLSALSCQASGNDFGKYYENSFYEYFEKDNEEFPQQKEITNAFVFYLWLYYQLENYLLNSIITARLNPNRHIVMHPLAIGEGFFGNYRGLNALIWKILIHKYAKYIAEQDNLTIILHIEMAEGKNFQDEMFGIEGIDEGDVTKNSIFRTAARVLADYSVNGYKDYFNSKGKGGDPQPIKDLFQLYKKDGKDNKKLTEVFTGPSEFVDATSKTNDTSKAFVCKDLIIESDLPQQGNNYGQQPAYQAGPGGCGQPQQGQQFQPQPQQFQPQFGNNFGPQFTPPQQAFQTFQQPQQPPLPGGLFNPNYVPRFTSPQQQGFQGFNVNRPAYSQQGNNFGQQPVNTNFGPPANPVGYVPQLQPPQSQQQHFAQLQQPQQFGGNLFVPQFTSLQPQQTPQSQPQQFPQQRQGFPTFPPQQPPNFGFNNSNNANKIKLRHAKTWVLREVKIYIDEDGKEGREVGYRQYNGIGRPSTTYITDNEVKTRGYTFVNLPPRR